MLPAAFPAGSASSGTGSFQETSRDGEVSLGAAAGGIVSIRVADGERTKRCVNPETSAGLWERPAASRGSKLTSLFVLSQRPDPLLLRVKLLLYEEGAAHVHEAARRPSVLGELRLLFLRPLRAAGLRHPLTARGLCQPRGQLGGDVDVFLGLVPGLPGATSGDWVPQRDGRAQPRARRGAAQVLGVPEAPVVHAHRVALAQPLPALLGGSSRRQNHAGSPRGPRCRLLSLRRARERPPRALPVARSSTGRAQRLQRWLGTLLFQGLEEKELLNRRAAPFRPG